MKFETISVGDIDDALAADGANEDRVAWLKLVLDGPNGIAAQLKKEPTRYRSFGPYWWKIKELLNAMGHEFGDNYEGSLGEFYPDDYLYVAAGMLISLDRIPNNFGNNRYVLPVGNGETVDYILEDREMESVIAVMDYVKS